MIILVEVVMFIGKNLTKVSRDTTIFDRNNGISLYRHMAHVRKIA